MNDLIEKLNKLLASSFAMYLKTHFFHWNVRGQDFFQYHEFLNKLYQDIFESVDTTAEEIKALNGIAYGSLTQYESLSMVKDQTTVPTIQEMISILYRDNETVINVLMEVHESASANKQYGLINYIEDRIDTHKKHGWMLRSSMASDSSDDHAVKEEKQLPIVEDQLKTYVLNPRDL
jgi:starvation-inducible DNA-binding protein